MFDHPPLGFTGLDRNKPVTIRHRHLPHWRQEGATYFVTFRLADSLPRSKLDQLREERERWLRNHPHPTDEETQERLRKHMQQIEQWLDQGSGSCVLRGERAAGLAEGRLRHFDGDRYALFSFVIMPNHVHACLKPLGHYDVDEILQAWKSVSAGLINRSIARRGRLWQDESFDRIVRDSEHLRRVVKYIEANPAKANAAAWCWTTPAWNAWLGR